MSARRFDEPHESDPSAPPVEDLPPLYPDEIDPTKPNIARVYDCLLGGKDNYPADREHAEDLLKVMPRARDFALANRYFLTRAVRFLAGEAGITQFIDCGSGLPGQDNVHQVAQSLNTGVRTVYVDNDPLVVAHGQGLLADNDRTAVIAADLRDPDGIVEHPDTRGLIDFNEPVAVLFVSVLHFLADNEDPHDIVDHMRTVMAPGSYVVISHGLSSPETRVAAALYQQAMQVGWPRQRHEIEWFFDGFELMAPGLVPIPQWRPEFGAAQLAWQYGEGRGEQEQPEPVTFLPGAHSGARLVPAAAADGIQDMPFLAGVGHKPLEEHR
jgi:hypothetical protein